MRVVSTSSDSDVLATAYLNDAVHGGTAVAVLINKAKAAKAVRIALNARPAPAVWRVTRTDRVTRRASIGALPAGAALLLPPRSVTTIVEQQP